MERATLGYDEVAQALFELSKELSRELNDKVPLTHLHALFRIAMAGDRCLGFAELERAFGLTPASMASTESALARLRFANERETRDVVEYLSDPLDKRRLWVRLTPHGRALFEEFASRFRPLRVALKAAA